MAEFASKGVAGSALGLAIGGLSAALLNNDGDGPPERPAWRRLEQEEREDR